ncbi:DUF6588 family protein [Aquimarina pacifica]|uniref:DUF6588 family protein n=1 Tax=Aquimarina pacifica TaxID=1296415 RepID=UPI0004711EDF|nr:DUF6588 family protein [Aquimarina pacifica]
MKRCFMLLVVLINHVAISQSDVDRILEIGIDNAQTFSKDYFAPVGELLVNSATNGWYNTAKTKKLWHFELGIVGNLSFIREDKQSFIFRVQEYTDITLPNGETNQVVSTALGTNQNDISVIIDEGQATQATVILPNGLTDKAFKSLPSGYIQGSMGLTKSTEIKVRFLPKTGVRGAEIQLYGVGFQHEFTDWVYPLKRWPVRVSALLGYTNIKGFYEANSITIIPGTDQEVQLTTNSWILTSIASTKFPVLNFYGGLGYYFGATKADLLGSFEIQNGPLASEVVINPIAVKTKTNGVKATFGTSVKFGVFKANLDYSFQNYSNISLGLGFGW